MLNLKYMHLMPDDVCVSVVCEEGSAFAKNTIPPSGIVFKFIYVIF